MASRNVLGDLAQAEFLDLAGGGLGQLTEHHMTRQLETGQMGAAMADQDFSRRLMSGAQFDKGARGFAPFGIGARHHRGEQNRRMAGQRVFHFDGRNILAPEMMMSLERSLSWI